MDYSFQEIELASHVPDQLVSDMELPNEYETAKYLINLNTDIYGRMNIDTKHGSWRVVLDKKEFHKV